MIFVFSHDIHLVILLCDLMVEREAKSWVKNDLPNIINQLEHVETLDENLTMGELVEKYKQHISLRLKPTTVATKEHIIDKKILPFFKDKVVYKILTKRCSAVTSRASQKQIVVKL